MAVADSVEAVIVVHEYRPGKDGNVGAWENIGEVIVDALHFAGDQPAYCSLPNGLRFRATKIDPARHSKRAQPPGGMEDDDAGRS